LSPAGASELIPRLFATLPNALQHYGPDGAWYEGPGYWKYGTTYLAMLLDALGTALGQDGGLGDTAGLARTGEFFRDALGAKAQLFNYADSRTQPGTSPTLFWLARRYGRPDLADSEHHLLQRYINQLRTRSAATSRESAQAVKLGDAEASDILYSNRFFALELIWYHPGTAAGALTSTGSSFFPRGHRRRFSAGGAGLGRRIRRIQRLRPTQCPRAPGRRFLRVRHPRRALGGRSGAGRLRSPRLLGDGR
jgi:hypothetical protein